MGSKAPQLLEAALKLPPEARAAMAGSNPDTIVDADAEQQWEQEIAPAQGPRFVSPSSRVLE